MYSVTKDFGRSRYVVRVRSLSETWLDEAGKPDVATPPFRGVSNYSAPTTRPGCCCR